VLRLIYFHFPSSPIFFRYNYSVLEKKKQEKNDRVFLFTSERTAKNEHGVTHLLPEAFAT